MTPEQISNELVTEITLLRQIASEYADACLNAANADHEWERLRSRSYLENIAGKEKKPTDTILEAMAMKAHEIDHLQYKITKAAMLGLKARMDTCTTRISVLQSLLKKETEEMKAISFAHTR